MADRVNISIGLTADIQDFIKNLQNQFGSLKGLGLDKAAKTDIDNIMKMLNDLSKSISNLGGSKVNTSTFAKAQKEILDKVQMLEARTNALEQNMASLISTMSKADGGKFANQMKEIAQTMEMVSESTQRTVNSISSFSNESTGRIDSLKANLVDLERIIETFNKDFDVKMDFTSFKAARDYLVKLYTDIQSLKKEATSIGTPTTDEDVRKLAVLQQKIVELSRTFEEVYDQQLDGPFASQFEKATIAFKKGDEEIKRSFDDLEENLDATMQSIVNNVKNSIRVAKTEIESLADAKIDSAISTDSSGVSQNGRGLTVPLDISTKSSTLLKRAIEIINVVNDSLKDSPVHAEVVLTTEWGTRKSNELLKQFQSQIDSLSTEADVSELRKLSEEISASFGNEINLKFKSNFDKEQKAIQKGIADLKRDIRKGLEVNPRLRFSDEDKAAFKAEIDEISAQLDKSFEHGSVVADAQSIRIEGEGLEEIKETLFDIARFGLDANQALKPIHNLLYEMAGILKGNILAETRQTLLDVLDIVKQIVGLQPNQDSSKGFSVIGQYTREVAGSPGNIDGLTMANDELVKSANNAIEAIANEGEAINDLQSGNPLLRLAQMFGEYKNSHLDDQRLSLFWEDFVNKAHAGEEAVKNLLVQLGFTEEELSRLKVVSEGLEKNGGIIGDSKVILGVIDASEELVNNAEELKDKLEKAKELGVNVARIIGQSYDKASGTFVEMQERAVGKEAVTTERLSYGLRQIPNPDVLNATHEQIQKLILDLMELHKLSVGTDLINLSNLFYDVSNGFELVDFKNERNELSDFESFITETTFSIVSRFKNFYSEINDANGINRTNDFQKGFLVSITEMVKNIENILKMPVDAALEAIRQTQNSNSPSKESEKLGSDFGEGYAKGIEGKVESVRKAAKSLADAATSELKKASNITVNVKTAKDKPSSSASSSSPEADFTADDQALQDAYRQADEYQKREAEYIKLRNQYLKEGQKQAQEITKQAEAEAKAQQKAAEEYEKWWIKALDAKERETEKAAKAAEKEAKASQKVVSETQRLSKTQDIQKFMIQNKNLTAETRVELEKLIERLRHDMTPDQLKQIGVEFKSIANAARSAGETTASWADRWRKQLGNLSRYLTTFVSFYKVVDVIKRAFSTVYELDTALVDLRKTTTMTSDELNQFYFDANNVAKQMGVTTAEIINQASAWSRLGYSSKEAATEMAALSSQFAQISPGMSVENATDGLVSTMKAFHIDVADVEREVMDNVNIIGNRMATTNDEVVEMLKRSSAAMNAANNSLQETIALESAAVQITRNAETTGTAFRTISMRIRGLDEETEEAMEDFDALKGKIADLTKTAKTPGGISLFTDEAKTQYKSTYQLLKDIAEIYHDLTDKEQAELLEALAGKRGGQVLAGILDDFSEVERAMREMQGAAGSADKEMGIIEESWQYKLNNLKQTWIGFFQDLIDRGVISDLIDKLTQLSESIIKIVEINPTGVITMVGGLTALFAKRRTHDDSTNLFSILKDIDKENVVSFLENVTEKLAWTGNAVEDANDVVENTGDILSTVKDVAEDAADGIDTVATVSEGATTVVGAFGGALKALLMNPYTWLIVGLTTAAIGFKKAWDAANVTVEEVEQNIQDVEGQISSLSSEIEQLESKDFISDAEQERIDLLKEELELQEANLEMERRRRAEELVGTKLTDRADKDNWNTILSDYQYYAHQGGGLDAPNVWAKDFETYKTVLEEDKKALEELTDETEKYWKLQDIKRGEENLLGNRNSAFSEYSKLKQAVIEMDQTIEALDSVKDADVISQIVEVREKFVNEIDKLKPIIDETDKLLGRFDYSSTIESVFQHTQFDGVKDVLFDWAKAGDLTEEKLIDRYPVLIKELEDAGVNAEELYKWLMAVANADPTKGAWEKEFARITAGLDASKSIDRSVFDLLSGLNSEERQILIDANIDWSTFNPQEKHAKIQQLLNQEGPVEIDVEPMSISETIDSINTKIKPALDTLGDVYSQVLSGKNQLIEGSLGTLDLIEATAKIKAQLDSLNKMKGITVDYTAFEHLVEVLQDTKSSGEDVQNAFNDVATSITNSGIKGTESIKTVIEALSDMGIENAVAVTIGQMMQDLDTLSAAGLDLQKISAETSIANDEQRNSAYQLIDVWAEEAVGAENAAEAAALLKMQMILLNQNALDESDSINELARLAGMAGVAADAIYELIQLESDIGVAAQNLTIAVKSGQTSLINEATAQLGALNDRARDLKNQINADITDAITAVYTKSPATKSAGGAGKEAGDAYVDAFTKELEKLKNAYERGDITLKDYLAQWKALIQKFFADNPKYAEEYANQMKSYLDAVKGYYSGAISGVTTLLQGRISSLQKQRDKAIKNLEKEKETALAGYQAQIDAIDKLIKEKNKQIKQLEKEKKAIDKKIKPLQDEIDAIQKANEERQRQIDLQKDLYELERAQNQRTQFVLKDNQMVYQTDPEAARQARDQIKQDEEDQKIAKLEEQIELYEHQKELIDEQIEAINEEIEMLNEEKEAIEEQMKAIEEYYDNLIKETEEMFDEMIEGLEEILEKWQQLAELESIKNAWKDVGGVMEMLGYTVEDVLNDTPGAFEAFKNAYIDTIMQLDKGNSDSIEGIKEWGRQTGQEVDAAIANFQKLGSETTGVLDPLKEPLDNATKSTKDLGDNATTASGGVSGLASSTGELADKASDADEKVSDLTEATKELPDSLNEINNVTFDGIIANLDALRQKLTEIKLALGEATTGSNGEMSLGGGMGSIGGALRELNNIAFDQLIANFELLQGAISAVSSLLGGSTEGNGAHPFSPNAVQGAEGAAGNLMDALNALNGISFEDGLIAQFQALEEEITKVITLLGGGGGESQGGPQAGGGLTGSSKGGDQGGESGADNLVGALQAVKEAADMYIGGGEEEGEGGTVISDFAMLLDTITENVNKLGPEDAEDTLANMFVKVEKSGKEHIPTLIDLFSQLAEIIGKCASGVETVITGLEKLSGMGSGGGFASSLVAGLFKYQGTAKVGNANLKGNWAFEGGKTLISELGPELVVTPDGRYTVYDKPQLVNLPKGSVIFNHLQSEEILKRKNQISSFGKAHLNGTAQGLMPLSDNAIADMVNLANALRSDSNVIKTDIGDIKRHTEEISRTIQNVTNNNSNSANVTFSGDMHFECNGVTAPEVLNEIQTALNQTFEGMALNAYQHAMAR